MTRWLAIRDTPTILEADDIREQLVSGGPRGWHESLLQGYQILQETKRLLKLGTPTEVVLDLIALMEGHDD